MTSTALRPLDFAAASLDDDVDVHLGLPIRLRAWAAVHARSMAILGVLLPLVGVLHGWNMYRSPAINITDDEGTYVSQAWAVDNLHQLASYTYWYDHPPLGWIQIGGYAWLTDAWSRAPYSVAVGREFMLVVDLVACVLLYALGRRLSLSRWASAAAVVLFAASPLALQYHRMVWLDNIGVAWMIAALLFAASKRASLSSTVGSAVCLAVGVLSKETVLILAPVVLYVLWQHSDVRTRRYRVVMFSTLSGTLVLFYPLYAAVKNELFPGPGHVSLLWAIGWQLKLRRPNGSIFDNFSGAADYFHSWLRLDPWLLAIGLALALPALLVPAPGVRRLRPLAFGLILQLLLMLRHGYLPEAYIVAMLPFAALVVAGSADQVARLTMPRIRARQWHLLPVALPLLVCAFALALLWARADASQLTGGSNVRATQAVAWIKTHTTPGRDHVVTDDNVWLDLVRAGYDPHPPHWSVVWAYKLGTDPSVKLPPGDRAVDYFMYAVDPIYAAKESPQIVAPYRQSRIVAVFGSGDNRITIRKVFHKASGS